MVDIERPDVGETDRIAGLWVELARDMRAYGSHLLPEENRSTIRESVARYIVTRGVLVARDGEELVGFVMFRHEDGSYEQDVHKGVVQNIYVVAARRGEGIGTRLLEAAEAALRGDGAEVISLDVMVTNEDARRFYRRHGYTPHRVTMEQSESDRKVPDEEQP